MKKIIFDTDIGTDPDDAGALAILQEAHNRGIIQLIGITISTPKKATAGCVDAINRYYKNVVPLGQTRSIVPHESDEEWNTLYAYEIAHMFENSYGDEIAEETGAKVLRRLLAENTGVTLLVTGNFTNIAELIDSQPDEISELNGKDLLNRSVDRIVSMAGEYEREEEHEYNIYCDIEAARKTFDNFTGYIDTIGFTEGCKLQSGKCLFEKDMKNPAGMCYYIHLKGSGNSWDPIPAFVTCYGGDGVFEFTEPGKITINELGYAFYVPEENGKHRVIKVIDDLAKASKRLNDAMCGDREI